MRALLLAGLWLASGILAAAERPPSTIVIDGGRDSAGGAFGGLDAGIGLGYGDLISAGFSSSRVKNSIAGGTTVTRDYYFSYTFQPTERWSFTPGFEVWGAKSDLTSRSLSLETALNLEDWSFGLQPEYKTLIWTSADHPGTRKRTGAVGVHAYAEYLGLEHWAFELRGGNTAYGSQRFKNFLYTDIVSDSAFAASSGLVRSYFAGALRFRAGDWRFNLRAQKSTYVIDGSTSVSLTGGIKWHFHPQWQTGLFLRSERRRSGKKWSAFATSNPNSGSVFVNVYANGAEPVADSIEKRPKIRHLV